MAEMVTNLQVASRTRLRSMVVPREHGAWGMLLVPMVIGAVVGLHSGENVPALVSLVVAAVTLFWLRTPVEALLGTTVIKARTSQERHYLFIVSLALGSLAALCFVCVFWGSHNAVLLPIGAVAAAAFGIQALVKRVGRKGRMPAQIIGAVGLTSTAAAAYCVANGGWTLTAAALWALNFIFAADQVHYVQVRIHTSRESSRAEVLRKGDVFLFAQVLMLAVLAAAWYCSFVPWFALVAFVPVLVRGFLLFLRRPRPLDVHRLGWTELANALIFGALISAAYWNH